VTAAGTKNLTFNGGTLICTNTTNPTFNNAVPLGFTTTAGTGVGTISMTGGTGKAFSGAGSTFNCTLNVGGAGVLIVYGANTFDNITNTVNGTTISFQVAVTNTFNNFNLNGISGNLTTINSTTAGARATLSKASGTVSCSYLSIKDSNATGGATWNAINSTNVSNNLGWVFSAIVAAVSNFFLMF